MKSVISSAAISCVTTCAAQTLGALPGQLLAGWWGQVSGHPAKKAMVMDTGKISKFTSVVPGIPPKKQNLFCVEVCIRVGASAGAGAGAHLPASV